MKSVGFGSWNTAGRAAQYQMKPKLHLHTPQWGATMLAGSVLNAAQLARAAIAAQTLAPPQSQLQPYNYDGHCFFKRPYVIQQLASFMAWKGIANPVWLSSTTANNMRLQLLPGEAGVNLWVPCCGERFLMLTRDACRNALAEDRILRQFPHNDGDRRLLDVKARSTAEGPVKGMPGGARRGAVYVLLHVPDKRMPEWITAPAEFQKEFLADIPSNSVARWMSVSVAAEFFGYKPSHAVRVTACSIPRHVYTLYNASQFRRNEALERETEKVMTMLIENANLVSGGEHLAIAADQIASPPLPTVEFSTSVVAAAGATMTADEMQHGGLTAAESAELLLQDRVVDAEDAESTPPTLFAPTVGLDIPAAEAKELLSGNNDFEVPDDDECLDAASPVGYERDEVAEADVRANNLAHPFVTEEDLMSEADAQVCRELDRVEVDQVAAADIDRTGDQCGSEDDEMFAAVATVVVPPMHASIKVMSSFPQPSPVHRLTHVREVPSFSGPGDAC